MLRDYVSRDLLLWKFGKGAASAIGGKKDDGNDFQSLKIDLSDMWGKGIESRENVSIREKNGGLFVFFCARKKNANPAFSEVGKHLTTLEFLGLGFFVVFEIGPMVSILS